MTVAMPRRYGWRPDLPDSRDLRFSYERIHLPESVDLRPLCPPVYDQGTLGSCSANAIAGAMEFLMEKEGQPDMRLSRLFIYYNERFREGTVFSDSGASLRDGMKVVNQYGVCPEIEWPYLVAYYAQRPLPLCFQDALEHRVKSYQRLVPIEMALQTCLAQGFPFVFGFTVYESFESEAVAKSGVVPMPRLDERVLGGHAVMAVGYDDLKRAFLVRNSWGSEWGLGGYFYLPYGYVAGRLASDHWTMRLI